MTCAGYDVSMDVDRDAELRLRVGVLLARIDELQRRVDALTRDVVALQELRDRGRDQ